MTLTLLLTDNDELLNRFLELLKRKRIDNSLFHFAYSPENQLLCNKYEGQSWIRPLQIASAVEEIISRYKLIIGLHSKQLFPASLVKAVRCINVHPGLNPYNRGWFPQVFSIINHLPCGATLHEMDEKIDHGPIIARKEVEVHESDTSLSLYQKVTDAELELLDTWLERLLSNNYQTSVPEEGNINLKKDFDELCRLNMDATGTLREHIDLLRALTHGDNTNAFFTDRKGGKVFVNISLNKKEVL